MSGTAPASTSCNRQHREPGPIGLATFLVLAACHLLSLPAVASDWPPLSETDRALKSVDPDGPGAILLFEEAEVDDRRIEGRLQSLYRRFKILLPSGESWATFVVSLNEPAEELVDIDGRTITPDGKELPLNRSDVTRSTTPGGRTELTFRLPGAAVGCVVEYRYAVLGGEAPPVDGWIFQHEIPCQRSTYLWHPAFSRTSRWVLLNTDGFEPLVEPIFRANASDSLEAARFEIRDLPAVRDEPWGPPPLETRARVVTLYDPANLIAKGYWRTFAAIVRARELEFAAGRSRLEAELAVLDLPADEPAVTIRRLYEFTQARLVNSAAGGGPTPPVPDTVDSLLALGTGGPDAVNLLFIAALESRHITATRAFTVDRDRAFFHPDILSPAQFHRSLVAVSSSPERVYFFAPGVPFAPPGILPWYAQGVTAVAASDSGAMFVPTPIDPAEVNRVRRTAQLTLDGEGRLRGRVRVDTSGQLELELRQALALAGRKGLLDHLATQWRPTLPSVRLDSLVTRNDTDPSRDLSLDLALRATSIGRRVDAELLVNTALIARLDRNPLGPDDAPRRQPVLVRWPEVSEDFLTLTPPRDWAVETLPPAVHFTNEFGSYEALWLFDGINLIYQRSFTLSAARLDPGQSRALRELLDVALAGDSRLVALSFRPVLPSRR
ncbi:MAG: DUF3857 domain-containing protein [Candidatus Eisenbacteria bacterium]|nr:DUF3857 domain-containing protein [Candidatus Eisenbacteria bacterium]